MNFTQMNLERIGMKMYKMMAEVLMEGLSLEDAVAIFNKYGVPNADALDADKLKSAWVGLSKKYHPDVSTHGKEAMQNINAAYDVLSSESGNKSTRHSSPTTHRTYSKPTTSTRPAWQTDPYAMVSSDEPVKPDVNYYKKTAWEISGKPTGKDDVYTFWNWDGYYFRGVFTVFTTPKHWYEVSNLLVEWDSSFRSKAVFVSSNDSHQDLKLVNLGGKKIDPPQIFTHNSRNQNPGNDWEFTDKLRKII